MGGAWGVHVVCMGCACGVHGVWMGWVCWKGGALNVNGREVRSMCKWKGGVNGRLPPVNGGVWGLRREASNGSATNRVLS